jgi:hypothetical protein
MMKAENTQNPEYTKNSLSYHHLFMPKIITYIIQWETGLVKQLFASNKAKAYMKKADYSNAVFGATYLFVLFTSPNCAL